MTSVLDVAQYILKREGRMTAMKLQKLVYYAQAWGLVWDERPLFKEPIEAWANGPVVRALYDEHRGSFVVGPSDIGGTWSKLDEEQRDTVRAVLRKYGDKGANWLSDLIHREDPWRDARKGLSEGERGSRVITHAAMAEYYGNL